MGVEVYHKLKLLLTKEGLTTAIGDEGGFAPDIRDAKEVFLYLKEAVEEAGYEPGKDFVFAMDAAANELTNGKTGRYDFPGEAKMNGHKVSRTSEELVEYYEELASLYPLVSIEDGLSEDDWDGWQLMTRQLGDKIQLVGDDLFVTNVCLLNEGIQKGMANSILIKPNQIGTLSETLDAVNTAKEAGYTTIISHRSGETEDTFIADLAVGVNAGQIKTGSMSRSERIAKYNQLIRIEEELGSLAKYPGLKAFRGQRVFDGLNCGYNA